MFSGADLNGGPSIPAARKFPESRPSIEQLRVGLSRIASSDGEETTRKRGGGLVIENVAPRGTKIKESCARLGNLAGEAAAEMEKFHRYFRSTRIRGLLTATHTCSTARRVVSSIELTRNNISPALCAERGVELPWRPATSFIKLNNGPVHPARGYQPSSDFQWKSLRRFTLRSHTADSPGTVPFPRCPPFLSDHLPARDSRSAAAVGCSTGNTRGASRFIASLGGAPGSREG